MKKTITSRILPAILFLIILAAVFFPKQGSIQGTRTSEPTKYLLDFTQMTGEDSAVLSLKAGDILHCSWNITSGRADITIGLSGQEPIYRGNQLDYAAFDLVIPEDGTYLVTFSARKAAGTLHIMVQ